MIRLQNDSLARMLHHSLYERMLHFCTEYTPELPGEPVVSTWLNRLFSDDQDIHILVELNDNYQIIEHAVIDVQTILGYKVVYCHQVYRDKNNLASFDVGMEYIDKLRQQVGARCSMFSTVKHVQSLSKKYGYKVVRTVMMKCDDLT